MSVRRLIVIHGPNLNLLGEREPEIYGALTLAQLNGRIRGFARKLGVSVRLFQSNSEGSLIDWIHKNRKWAQGIVINPGAYTHYSYALYDAIKAVSLPAVEVHLSDPSKRARRDKHERFRSVSVIAPACVAQVCGLGADSYRVGMEKLKAILELKEGL